MRHQRLILLWGIILLLLTGTATHAESLRVCMVSGSFEYDSDAALRIFKAYLENRFDAECTLLCATDWENIQGLEALQSCDVALFYTRRLRLKNEQLDRIKAYCQSGKPIVAIRTASHGFQPWLAFDKEILGGNYGGHYGEGPTTEVRVAPLQRKHVILEGVGPIRSRYSLYRTAPLADDATVLMWGSIPSEKGRQPLAWTRERQGQRVFYTSLGGVGDFEHASFARMTANALFWAAGRTAAARPLPAPDRRTPAGGMLRLPMRTRVEKAPGSGVWEEADILQEWPVAKTAIILCDMWDKHWCGFASARVDAMAPRMNDVVSAARDAGVQIIHAPSDTLGFYQDTPQRRRMQLAPAAESPTPREITEAPLPIDDSDGGCPEPDQQYGAWTRQHPAITIGPLDGISDNGQETLNFLRQEGIQHLIFTGVHTNMCILGRSFAIRQMTRWGFDCALVRNLTDSMYNPAMPPHVSHDEGTELVVKHIEKYWCPSMLSDALLQGLPEKQSNAEQPDAASNP